MDAQFPICDENEGRTCRPGRSDGQADAAKNDPSYRSKDHPEGLSSIELIEEAVRSMLDAPPDLPALEDAVTGLTQSLRSLKNEVPGAEVVAEQSATLNADGWSSAAKGATVLALTRRKGRHLMYALAREIGHGLKIGKVPDEQLCKIVGLWSLTSLLCVYEPPPNAIAKIKKEIFSGRSESATWSAKARAQCMTRAMKTLKDAIAGNQTAAFRFGLGSGTLHLVQTKSEIDQFNCEFRRRFDGLVEWATMDAVAGAGGNGTLCAAALYAIGGELMDMAKTGDNSALLVCIEIETDLPSAVALQIPIQIGEANEAGALAWIDINAGRYYQTLYSGRDRGGKIPVGTEPLYVKSSWVYWLPLPTPIADRLSKIASKLACDPKTLGDILGDVAHHPRASVAGSGAYRATARKLQDSLPDLLLQKGHHRWPTALATSSPYLVSAGKKSYGVCRLKTVHVTWNSAMSLLNWPLNQTDQESSELVGSPLCARPESITIVLNFLCDKCNEYETELKGTKDVINVINAYAYWIAAVLSFCLALRKSLIFCFTRHELTAGKSVHFDDKNVHAFKGPGVPICEFAKHALDGWFQLCSWAEQELTKSGTGPSLALAKEIRERLATESSLESIFYIDLTGRSQSIGYKTWHDRLPKNLRLVPNFGRQFWPLQLIDEGLEQFAIDLLMRHQIPGMHPGSSHSVKPTEKMENRLRAIMDRIVSRLHLRLPNMMREAMK